MERLANGSGGIDEQKLVRMQEIMNLKDLALEGMTSKLVKVRRPSRACSIFRPALLTNVEYDLLFL